MADVLEMLEQMRELRNRTYKQLGDVSEEQMLAPTSYGDRSVNVRFMFYRLIAHEVEHTVHLVKTLNALHVAQGEAGLILKNLQAARGELEGCSTGSRRKTWTGSLPKGSGRLERWYNISWTPRSPTPAR